MAIWRLSPNDLHDPNWELSSHRAVAIVRAPSEDAARDTAAAAFDLPIRYGTDHRIKAPPWKRAELVTAERIEDDRFDPDGPAAVLVPSV